MALFSRKSQESPEPVAADQRADTPPADGDSSIDIPMFGARAKARELAEEVEELRGQLTRLGAFEVVELERRKTALEEEIAAEQARQAAERASHLAVLEDDRQKATQTLTDETARLKDQIAPLEARLYELRSQVVVTEEVTMLQEAGLYDYRHPLDDSVAYKEGLALLKDQVKDMVKKDGGAVSATTNWTVEGSAPKGRKMVRDFSKLMLRAYNAEADTLVRGLKPYKLDAAADRLDKVRETIARLGSTMNIRISEPYHQLRILELELTADYVQKLAEERERDREEKERLREERKAQQELEKEKAKLEKERQHYENALRVLQEQQDAEGIARLEAQLADVDSRIENVDYRAANIRAGYVYVISNIGSFGEQMIKIGMTRRLDPLDRVRELGDASVPFRFDVHALFFSDDAVGIEASMHARLADRRVNRVNLRREFFRATPQEAKTHLADLAGELLQYEELPEALEWHQSRGSNEPVDGLGEVAIADSHSRR